MQFCSHNPFNTNTELLDRQADVRIILNSPPTVYSSSVPCQRGLQPCLSSREEMPSPEEAYLKDSPAPFVLALLSSLAGTVSQPAPPTGPPSPLPGLLAAGLNID